ncbi:MAG: hypothetical protein DBP02_15160 [gamma proteobacterium symbiont of Ctena orbiculata]|nr:MAG: hypothetical protein DBP02_15160 [gamma proteobacterium symbiont of Ctena orbiculata]
MPYKVINPPVDEPLTLGEAKEHLREPASLSAHDTQIEALIKAAREYAEEYTRRAFITQTIEMRLDDFADEIELPKPPLQSVISIEYFDADGVLQTLATSVYSVDTTSTPGRVTLNDGESWPGTKDTTNAVIITFTAGYGVNGTDVPETIRQALRLYLSKHFDLDRNDGEYLDKALHCMLKLKKVWSL